MVRIADVKFARKHVKRQHALTAGNSQREQHAALVPALVNPLLAATVEAYRHVHFSVSSSRGPVWMRGLFCFKAFE